MKVIAQIDKDWALIEYPEAERKIALVSKNCSFRAEAKPAKGRNYVHCHPVSDRGHMYCSSEIPKDVVQKALLLGW